MSDDPDFLYALKLQQQLDAEMANVNAELPHTKEDSDYQLALMLQNEVNNDSTENIGDDSIENVSIRALDMTNNNDNKNISFGKDLERRNGVNKLPSNFDSYLDQTQNLVHPEWEMVDPTPDIYAMFVRFDEKFFQKRLGAVSVEWSKRMYSCAGICYQRGNRFVKDVIIRLSEPLLKLRPRKDLVETLLHEMIHAYCFVLNIREGNGGHGPNFKRIMETINKVAGTNITVYHSFHDEVNAYKTHIWRCNGICQHHHPFQGYVKRTSNRPPGPNDQWWAKHQSECGGYFKKISEPPKAAKPVTKPKIKSQTKPKLQSPSKDDGDIRIFFGKPTVPFKKVPNIMEIGNVAAALPPTSYPGTSSKPFEGLQPRNNKRRKTNEPNKIVGFKDLTGADSSGDEDRREPKGGQQTNEMLGNGYSLTNNKAGNSLTNMSDASKRTHLRDMWAKRFMKTTDNENTEVKKESTVEEQENSRKRRRPSSDGIITWESYDDDIMVRDVVVPTINISDSEDDGEDVVEITRPTDKTKRNPQTSSHELTTIIKREIMEDESIYEDADIMMIDDEYDDDVDSLAAATELADQSIIDDIFGEDTLLQEFQRENDVVPSGSRNRSDAHNDITTCPICFDKMRRSEFANHLEGCSIIIRVQPPSFKGKTHLPTSNSINNGKSFKRTGKKSSKVEILKSSGYTDSEIAALNLSSTSDSSEGSSDALTPRQMRQRSLFKNTVQCPKCGQELLGHQLEVHRKICQRKTR